MAEKHARANELAHRVDDLVTDWPEDGYFIDGDVTSYEDYCRACIDEAFAKAPGKDLFIGSTCGAENDGCLHCASCGRLIAYSLTDHGVRDELAHFRENRLGGEWNDGLGSDDFYEIARAAIAAHTDELADQAIQVCEWALSLQGFSRQAARWADDGGPQP